MLATAATGLMAVKINQSDSQMITNVSDVERNKFHILKYIRVYLELHVYIIIYIYIMLYICTHIGNKLTGNADSKYKTTSLKEKCGKVLHLCIKPFQSFPKLHHVAPNMAPEM